MGARTGARVAIGAGILAALCGGLVAMSARQAPVVQPLDETVLREHTGVYQWGPNAFVYLQMWDEFSGFGKPQLVAFDESGDVRTLYPTDGNQFFAGPGAALSASIESRIAFQRDSAQPDCLARRGSMTVRRRGLRNVSRSKLGKTCDSRIATCS